MSQYLPQRTPFASASDERRTWPWVQQHSRVDQRLVIDVFVPLGGLSLAVEDQTATEDPRLQNFYFLVGGFPGIENFPHLKHYCQVR